MVCGVSGPVAGGAEGPAEEAVCSCADELEPPELEVEAMFSVVGFVTVAVSFVFVWFVCV